MESMDRQTYRETLGSMAMPLLELEIGDLPAWFSEWRILGRGDLEACRAATPHSFVLAASCFRVVYANPMACDLLGHGPSELQQSLTHIWLADKAGLLADQLAAVVERQTTFRSFASLERRDGPDSLLVYTMWSVVGDLGSGRIFVSLVDLTRGLSDRRSNGTAPAFALGVASSGVLAPTLAAIAHEVTEPVSAMIANAQAALRWLKRTTPDLEKTRASLEMIVERGRAAGTVIAKLRSMG